MSSKVKSLMTLGSVIRTRPRIRPSPSSSLRSSALSPLPPSAASCSRWLTCSCCRSNIPRGTFFSPSSTTSQFAVNTPTELEDDVPIPPARQTYKTPHLPLPPSLPYSPKSHPFRRHLEILSLSLFSTPNESWEVYSALHPSLRQYIPDETFRNLLSHQLKHDQPRLAWHRAKTLLRLAKQCGMAVEDLGMDVITNTTAVGLQAILAGEKRKGNEKDYRVIRRLWIALSGMVDNFARIPLDVRRNWLKVQQRQIRCRDTSGPKSWSHKGDWTPVESAVVDLVERGGGDHLGQIIGRVLSHARGGSLDNLLVTLRLLAWSISKGAAIPTASLVVVMRKLDHRWSKAGQDGLASLKNEISKVLSELEASTSSILAENLEQAHRITVLRAQGRSQKILALLEASELGLQGQINRGISLAHSAGNETDVRDALKTSIRLFERVARYRDSDCNVLIAAITHALYVAHRSSDTKDVGELVILFARTIYEAQLVHTLPSESIIPLLRLVITAMPSHEAYILARKLYQYARAAEPSFRWSHHNEDQWRHLFRLSITPPNLHLHFASRLYADLMADGMLIRRTDALMMIRAVGMNPSPSRPILLERHIKDYLWMNYGQQSSLITAVVQGLSKTSVSDADLALNLAQRLAQSQELQPVVVQLIIGQLARSSKPQHQVKCLHLLRSLKPSPTTTWCFNTVLSNLVSPSGHIPNHADASGLTPLNYAIGLYKEMIGSGVRPNARTVSTMIRALLDGKQLNSALAVFSASIAEGLRLKSNSVGRLMVHLAIAGRSHEANEVEERWRSLAVRGKERSWDRGVVGARVLMEIQSGKEVDLEDVGKRTGWVGTPAFLAYLDTLKPPNDRGDVFTLAMEGTEALDQKTNSAPLFWPQEAGVGASARQSTEDGVKLFGGHSLGVVAF